MCFKDYGKISRFNSLDVWVDSQWTSKLPLQLERPWQVDYVIAKMTTKEESSFKAGLGSHWINSDHALEPGKEKKLSRLLNV
jgi:hypothetical protein